MENLKTILIIEQEANIANGLKSILQREGYATVSVFNYYHFKKLCEDKKPDLAIIDINISKEFGLNVLRKLKECFPSLPIIVTTVYSNSLNRKEIERLGASDFIAKPFDVDYLKERIGQLCGAEKCYQTSCIS